MLPYSKTGGHQTIAWKKLCGKRQPKMPAGWSNISSQYQETASRVESYHCSIITSPATSTGATYIYCNDWNADQTCQKIICWALYWVSNTQLAIFNWASGGKLWNELFRRTPKSGRRWWNTLIGWHAGWVQTFHWCINVLQINLEFCRAAGQLNKVFRRLHRFSEAWKAAGKQEGAFNLAAVTNTYNLRFFKPEI